MKKVHVVKKTVKKRGQGPSPLKKAPVSAHVKKTQVVPQLPATTIKKELHKPQMHALHKEKPLLKKQSHLVPAPVAKIPPPDAKLVVLDPGHGGYDLGAKMSSCDEKSLALSTALLTKKHLLELGYRVILTRSRDIFLSLERRTEIANQTKSKIFVSIHFNAAKSLTAKGIEIFFCHSQDKIRAHASKNLASKVLKKMIDHTSSENRGVKEGNFFVIRETLMPAILVEAGFMTHPEELHLLKDIVYRDKIARGISEGIDAYFKS